MKSKTQQEPEQFPSLSDLREAIRFDNENGSIWLEEQRMLLLHASAMGTMRQEMLRTLGHDYTRALLMRMGSASGQADAQLAKRLRAEEGLKNIFSVGPQLHGLEGIVNVELVRLEFGEDNGSFYGEFIWRNSFEAAEHLRLFGLSSEPVCWQLLGYACGYSTAIMERPIYFKEVKCSCCGDESCRIIGKQLEDWEDADELEKVFSVESLPDQLKNLQREVEQLREVIGVNSVSVLENIVADSPAIRDAMFMLEKAAETDVTVLMLGETGVGKEVFSRALHELGSRSESAFIAVNCAALPRTLIESELFGVERGAYTGADKSRKGRFEVADGGTLFLDELGELSERAQAKLLRVLQTGTFERVGSNNTTQVNVRLIAATNANLLQRVKEGTFRADLYYRLNVFPITIPPLRERKADLPGLMSKFINKHNAKYGKTITGVTDEVMQNLKAYEWPGNIRELENILERGVILSENHTQINSRHLCVGEPALVDSYVLDVKGGLAAFENCTIAEDILTTMQDSGLSFDSIERMVLESALIKSEGNVLGAARLLDISGPQCRYRLKKLNIIY